MSASASCGPGTTIPRRPPHPMLKGERTVAKKKTPRPKSTSPTKQMQYGPEPEGGPFARRKAVLEERLSRLAPKEEVGVEPSTSTPTTRTVSESAERGAPTGTEFRKQVVEAYRQRQRAQLAD